MKAVLRNLALALSVALLGGPALSGQMLTGEELHTLLSGNTVSGTMTEFGPYTEYYAPDGTIRSAYHEGTWKIEGDTACLTFDGNDAGCWNVGQDGDMLQWFRDGELLGNGIVEKGNPNGL
ncbi:MAG: hypothetical protein O2825_08630 [Proteobacteria bacterium]|nr:hypothetical protein [Pseudomonadota bacterium]